MVSDISDAHPTESSTSTKGGQSSKENVSGLNSENDLMSKMLPPVLEEEETFTSK